MFAESHLASNVGCGVAPTGYSWSNHRKAGERWWAPETHRLMAMVRLAEARDILAPIYGWFTKGLTRLI